MPFHAGLTTGDREELHQTYFGIMDYETATMKWIAASDENANLAQAARGAMVAL